MRGTDLNGRPWGYEPERSTVSFADCVALARILTPISSQIPQVWTFGGPEVWGNYSVGKLTAYPMEQLKLTTMTEPDRIKKPNRKRHERECSICSHPQREEIERDFIEWGSPIRAGLRAHRRQHLSSRSRFWVVRQT